MKDILIFVALFILIFAFITWAGYSGWVDQTTDYSEILGWDK